MMKSADRSQFFRHLAVSALVLVALCASSFAQDSLQQYTQTNLVSNLSTGATYQDPDLVNAWGISQSSTSPFWVSDNGTGVSTLYDGSGVKQGLTVTVPTGNASVNPLGTPTGTIYNGSSLDFLLAPGDPARFLFATYDGTISGWNSSVNATNAVIEVNQSGKSVFTGLAVAQVNEQGTSTTYLYAADFKQGRIEVFDTSFKPVTLPWGRFDDDWHREGFVPYNIWNIGGNLYVAYAQANDRARRCGHRSRPGICGRLLALRPLFSIGSITGPGSTPPGDSRWLRATSACSATMSWWANLEAGRFWCLIL